MIIIKWIIANTTEEEEAREIPNLFQQYGQSFTSYALGLNEQETLTSLVMRLIRYRYEEVNEEKDSQYTSILEVQDDYYWIKSTAQELIKKFHLDDDIVDNFADLETDEDRWHEKIEANKERENNAKLIEKHYTNSEGSTDSDDEIDDLFSLLRKSSRN